MRVMVVGSGAREHALVWKISQSKRVSKIYAALGNPGMRGLAELIDIKASNIIGLADFAQKENVDLTVVGPEDSLTYGIVDEFKKRNLRIFGPTKKAAVIESSKTFAKDFMKKNSIPTANYRVFDSSLDAINYIKSSNFPLVIKADGLAGGQGAFICNAVDEAEEIIRVIMLEKKFGQAGEQVVIEDFLNGMEMTFMVISDGVRVIPLVISMDYKKAFDNDQGPNTGGMGAICPAPQITECLFNNIMKSIIYPTLEGLRSEGKEFSGVLYAGLMITENGPFVLEFNSRFGDPETQAVLLRMQSDIVDLLEGSAEGNLNNITIEWDDKMSACVALSSRGFPSKFETGKKIYGLERTKSMGVEIFHAETELRQDGFYTDGGRPLNVCASAPSLKKVMKKIYDAISFITFDNIAFKKDIGRGFK